MYSCGGRVGGLLEPAVGRIKRICAVVLAGALVFGAAGCGAWEPTLEECRAMLDDLRTDREAVLREYHDAGCGEALRRAIVGHLLSGDLTATERLEACQALLDLSLAQAQVMFVGEAADTLEAYNTGCGTGYRGGGE